MLLANSSPLLKAGVFYLASPEVCKGNHKEQVVVLAVSKNPKGYNSEKTSRRSDYPDIHKTCTPPSQQKLQNKGYNVEVKEMKINEKLLRTEMLQKCETQVGQVLIFLRR